MNFNPGQVRKPKFNNQLQNLKTSIKSLEGAKSEEKTARESVWSAESRHAATKKKVGAAYAADFKRQVDELNGNHSELVIRSAENMAILASVMEHNGELTSPISIAEGIDDKVKLDIQNAADRGGIELVMNKNKRKK